MKTSLLLTMILALTLRCIPGNCAGISVGDGAYFNLGAATIDLNCLDLETTGQLALGTGSVIGVNLVSIESAGEMNGDTGSIQFSGDWWNAGTFNAAQSSVNIQDGCGVSESMMLGDNDFYSFSAATSTGKMLSIEAGSVQSFADNLTLEGAVPDDRLKIRSSVNGQSVYFRLAVQGVQQINAVDVKDNDASGGQLLVPGGPAQYASIDTGNNINWFELLSDLIFKDGFETD